MRTGWRALEAHARPRAARALARALSVPAFAPALTALALAMAPVAPALAQAPPPTGGPDSSLHRFLGSLADSTDRYFGLVAAPPDTTGLDSALAVRLAGPWPGPRTRTRFSYRPDLAFNRVDGNRWGASAALGSRGERWRVEGDLGYAAGSDRWLGGGRLLTGIRRRGTFWRLQLRGGRHTASMDRDHDEGALATVRALARGSDRQHYLRRDGFRVTISGDAPGWHAGIEYRDWLESPLVVTTRWNLARQPLDAPTNLAATLGRTRELGLDAGFRWPGLPLQSQITHHTSDRALGSDFRYRRTRVALAAELPLRDHVSFLPQLVYGRLAGDAVPQAAFYLGGPHTLRSLPGAASAGTGFALARLDAIGADDLLALAHIPHPAMLPIQGGLFVATGAVWGPDPYGPFGGPGTPTGGWPPRNAWRSEAGLSLLYRPGVPDENAYLRLHLAWPLGTGRGEIRWSVSYSRALDLLRPW